MQSTRIGNETYLSGSVGEEVEGVFDEEYDQTKERKHVPKQEMIQTKH